MPMMKRLIGLAALVGCAAPAGDPVDPCDACAAQGQLCEANACVEPWQYGSPEWSRCEADPHATPETLAEKAAAYDARVMSLHVHPAMPWVLDVVVDADPETATVDNVVAWRSGENDGLWSALVLAAEAYRYAATHDSAPRATLATLLHGEQLRMQITGVPGLFTRQLIPPGVAGIACPTDPAAYVPSPTKTSNVWVRVGAGGVLETADTSGQFHATTAHTSATFEGWCFLDNISQDEYAGHMFALGAVLRLVDDPELHAIAQDMATQIADHLLSHQMQFIDWDGRPTQWGKLYPDAPGGDSPGYLAVLGASYVASAGRADALPALDYGSYLPQIDIWSGDDACTSNWNDISMLTAAFHHLIWNDHAGAATWQAAFDRVLAHPTHSRGITHQHNAWYDVMYAAQKPLGPGTDGPAYDAVEDAVCQLREFPRSNHVAARDSTSAQQACSGRQDESMAAAAFSVADRCAATFAWWGNPYIRTSCADEPSLVDNPAGYLLPYWMARYYGFIAASD